MPESFFDTEKNEVKGAELRKHLDELATFKAADDSRRASLPQSPEGYEIKLPEGFKAPEGIDVQPNVNDPLYKTAQAMAHAKGWSQQDFSDALALAATMKANEVQAYETLKAKNLEALGANKEKRIDPVTQWLVARYGEKAKPMIASMATAEQVEIWENIIQTVTSQGTPSFRQTGREVDTGKIDEATYNKMSYGEKKAYAERMSGKAA